MTRKSDAEGAATPEDSAQTGVQPAPEPLVTDTSHLEVPTPPEEAEPVRVRLVPSDWTVGSVEFYDTDGASHIVTADLPGMAPYYVDTAEADKVIAVAAGYGFAIQKEAVR